MEYVNLKHTGPDAILAAFNETFSDYSVPMVLTDESLDRMLTSRGYDPAVSVGAFDGPRLVGFVLNGLRQWQGSLTAYDTGTGILPAYRGQGVASAMMAHSLALLRQAGAAQYLLEVIQDNTPAVSLYRGQGFRTLRQLLCYRLESADALPRGSGAVTLSDSFSQARWREAEALWSITPSWQNSPQSVMALPGRFLYASAEDAGGLAGYGIIDRYSGSLAQLAVRQDARGHGLGSALLWALAGGSEAESVSAVNVDAAGQDAIAFLQARGFSQFTGQYEMSLALD